MKIGISTIIDYDNYGNRLQNYASQQVLKSIGCEVETLPRVYNHRAKAKIKKSILLILINIYEKVTFFENRRLNQFLRRKRFIDFTNKYISYNKQKIKNYEELSQLNKNYDFVITGSDQVWNYNFRPNLEIDFLQFVEFSKRIAYAPSFGVSEIPTEYKAEYIRLINGVNSLSVREHAGAKIIKELTGKEATVLIDPTLMLSKEEWLQIANRPKVQVPKKYILTYVLGNQHKEFKEFVEKIAKERNLEILNLLNPDDKRIHSIDPSEFIYLINNADLMITDSFHGAVFSILMETPFVIFERRDHHVSMNSRIDTLVSTFKFENRLSSQINTTEEVFNINFDHVQEILQFERQKAIDYLKNAFNLSE